MSDVEAGDDARAQPPNRVRNAVTEVAAGAILQAGSIRGGVHIHAAAPDAIIPRQLRPAPAHFTGRRAELAELDRIAGGPQRVGPAVAVITGPGGVGKSALALRWLHGAADRFPDGQLSVDLGSEPVPLTSVLGRCLRAMGVSIERVPADVAEAAALFRSVTADKRIAVLVDNPMSAAQVRTLMPASPASVVVVATRWRLGGLAMDGAGFVTLPPLEPRSGVRLLASTVGDVRVAREPDAVTRLVELCGGLPIALTIVGARLAMRPGWSLARLVKELADDQRRLATLSVGQDVSVRAVFDLSYAGLAPPVARTYRWCALHPGPDLTVEAAAAMLELSDVESAECLETLVDASLLEVSGADRYQFHDLVRLHARQSSEREDPDGVRAAVVRRVVEYLLSVAVTAGRVVNPLEWRLGTSFAQQAAEPSGYPSTSAALDRMESELPNVMAALRAGAELGFDELVWQLCEAMWSLFLYRKHFSDWMDAYQLGIDAAGRCGNQAAGSRMHRRLGLAFHNLGRSEEAIVHGTAALSAARAAGHRLAESEALNLIGMANRAQGRHQDAIAVLRQVVDLDQQVGMPRNEAVDRRRLGQALSDAGLLDDAIGELRRAREQAAALPDAQVEANTVVWLAEALTRAGRAAEAIELIRVAWSILRESGSKQYRANVLMVWGEAAERLGDLGAAQDRLTEARDLYAEIGTPHVARVQARLDSVTARLPQDS